MEQYYISGDTITDVISNVQFFRVSYYDKFIKNFVKNTNYVRNFNEIELKEPLIIITKMDHIREFRTRFLPFLKNKFILITHYSDVDSGTSSEITNHPYLVKWYGQNMNVISNKTETIPIGLENIFWKRTNTEVIKKCSKNEKSKLLYLNFSLKSHSNRPIIMDILLKKGFNKNNNLPWNDYIEELSQYKFCVSPRGNGVDCHRTWECLYLGVIPIVEKSIQMNGFSDLPILFVEDYNNVTEDYLNSVYEQEFKNKKFNLEKLDLMYWNKKIKDEFKY